MHGPICNTVDEVARALGKSRSRVRQLCAAGAIPSLRLTSDRGACRVLFGDVLRTDGRDLLAQAWRDRSAVHLDEIAAALQLCRRTVDRAVRAAGLTLEDGRVPRAELVAWLLRRRRGVA